MKNMMDKHEPTMQLRHEVGENRQTPAQVQIQLRRVHQESK
jgi:hypothetical protein